MLNRKLKIEQHETNTTKNGDERRCSGEVSNSCYTRGKRRVIRVKNPMRKGWYCDYDKEGTSVVIFDTDITQRLIKSW